MIENKSFLLLYVYFSTVVILTITIIAFIGKRWQIQERGYPVWTDKPTLWAIVILGILGIAISLAVGWMLA